LSDTERTADVVILAASAGASLIGGALLVLLIVPFQPALAGASLAFYAASLVAAFAVSAAYHWASASTVKEWLRRLDHAAIFVLIAGTYAPFALAKMTGGLALGLFLAVLAIAGVALKLGWPRRFDRAAVALYLAQGWAILVAFEPLAAAVSSAALVLIVAAGVLYTVGVVFHVCRLRFQDAIWHGFVLAAAACHYAAVVAAVA